jgi:hypothetical protein
MAADRRQTRSQRIVFEGDADEATTNDNKAAAESPTGAAGASTKVSTKAIKNTPLFIPLPFLASATLKSISHDPINLILAIKMATKDFNESLSGTAPRDATENLPLIHDTTDGAKLFIQWLNAIHMNLSTKQNFQLSRTILKFRCMQKIAIKVASSPPQAKCPTPSKN